MEQDLRKPVSLEDKLKAENSLFLENCKVGDLGTIYAHKDEEVLALRGIVRG